MIGLAVLLPQRREDPFKVEALVDAQRLAVQPPLLPQRLLVLLPLRPQRLAVLSRVLGERLALQARREPL